MTNGKRERNFWLLSVLATLSICSVLSALASDKQTAGEGKPHKPTVARQKTTAARTVGIEALVKNPKAYRGRIAVDGVVAKVMRERGAFTLIDVSEFDSCGVTSCAEYSVPVVTSKDGLKGELPKEKDRVVAIGDVEPLDKGFRFSVQEVKRGGVTILSRVKTSAK